MAHIKAETASENLLKSFELACEEAQRLIREGFSVSVDLDYSGDSWRVAATKVIKSSI